VRRVASRARLRPVGSVSASPARWSLRTILDSAERGCEHVCFVGAKQASAGCRPRRSRLVQRERLPVGRSHARKARESNTERAC
jgi:hypothetical protein